MNTVDFQELINQKGDELYRDMPWRQDTRPYYILVSELMLQQTQVDRVIPKFEAFISVFPDERALAHSSLGDVLRMWQGLGYNRRAKFLHSAAQLIDSIYDGKMPDDYSHLLSLPGVGRNTAGAISVYAFNKPAIFIETNVRTVYIHHFFERLDIVPDADIIPIIEQTIDAYDPRRFYWALMDYGTWLKRSGVRNVGQSKQYKKQSALEGSIRQVRGQIIKALTGGELSIADLERAVIVDERYDKALSGLVKEGLVEYSNGQVYLAR